MADYTVDVFEDDETGYVVEVVVDDHSFDALSDVDLTGRVDGSVAEWDTATGKWIMGTGGGGGGGAPTDASYLVLGTDGTLTDERVLTAGAGITFTDAGAGSTLTVKVTDSTYQPLDSDLTAIAALSTTSFGRGLLALADAAALRSSAGLVLGTDIYSKAAVDSGFQPLDSDLTAIAALTTTSFGRSLLALADAAAARTALGLGGGTVPTWARRTDGGFWTPGGSFAALGPADITVAAVAGDVLEVAVHAMWNGGTGSVGAIDVATIVTAAPVNYLSNGAGTAASAGIPALAGVDGNDLPGVQGVYGAVLYAVQAGDLSGGNVTLQVRAKQSGANQAIYYTTDRPFQWSVRNLGQ